MLDQGQELSLNLENCNIVDTTEFTLGSTVNMGSTVNIIGKAPTCMMTHDSAE